MLACAVGLPEPSFYCQCLVDFYASARETFPTDLEIPPHLANDAVLEHFFLFHTFMKSFGSLPEMPRLVPTSVFPFERVECPECNADVSNVRELPGSGTKEDILAVEDRFTDQRSNQSQQRSDLLDRHSYGMNVPF